LMDLLEYLLVPWNRPSTQPVYDEAVA